MEKSTITLGNGTRLAYLERAGNGQSLVLLHGITDSARTYEPLLDGIHADCRVFALDFRGHGDSDKPETLYDTDAYTDDVRHFIREVVGGAALVAGHSLGGAVAVQVGSSASELVTGLFLEDPPLYFVNNLNEVYRSLFNGIVMMAKTLQDGSRSAEEWFQVMADAPDPYTGKPGLETMGPDGIRLRLASIALMKPKALEDALAGSLEWDTEQVLGRLQCPVTLLTGNAELGAVITADESGRIAEIVGGSHVLRVDAVGHLIHDQQPEAWLGALNDFIANAAG